MDWYDTAGESWLDTAFGDVNIDSYHDVVAADDPAWLETASYSVDLEPIEVDGLIGAGEFPLDPASVPDDLGPLPAALHWNTPDPVAAGGTVWTLPSPW